MNIKTLTPKQSLNKAYRKATVFREEFDTFRKNLSTLFDNIDHEEREDNHKIHLKNFLDDNYYKGKHLINSKNSTDLVIYLENKQSSNAGVMLEVKRPTNKSEMITLDNINRKAFHELVLYYLQERIERKNDEIKYLIATNIYEWFIFDAVLFENLFYKNRKLIEDYTKWKDDQKVSGSTEHFYNEIVKPFLDDLTIEILFTYFNLENYKKLIHKTDDATEEKFIPLYKILSPVHLLKQPFANDSNSLDRNFYHELLHIIGLEEEKDKNKKVINRKDTGDRDSGSFIENTIQILKVDGALDRIKEPEKFGSNKEDQLYHIALELSLTWINRILFLKLLESQLFNYHKNDDYKFLNIKTITDFDELYKLFHSVLAIRINDRVDKIKTKYAKVPYLNSSLFEITELENQAIRINQLDDSHSIKIYKSSKLDKKKNEKLNTLQYLFEFLDAYNFTSEGKEKIEEEKKSLINASVLGLIFEKINGYKDGSYFTPGFITMYMCRETIRRAVIQKFNEKYNWNCETFDDLKNHLAGKKNTKDIIEANEVVNSIKICDPAVGSGHFLVSALNEIITIKAELGILADDKGVILSGYEVRIENDELIITYNYGEDIFEYHPSKSSKDKPNESQRVQEILFTQKQTIIENCLFGVDINPNSVKIAQLRLWIELLKNAYYTKESGYTELETLPNIDINIKEGNSLVSKFDIHHDIFPSGSRKIFDVYKINVGLYKNEHNRDKRKELKKSIESTKERIRGFAVDPLKKENEIVDKLTEELHKLNTVGLFDRDMTDEEKEKTEKKRNVISDKLNKAIEQRKSKAEEYKALYANAFEWRFEFPEVLDEEGNFVGFNVVIGNPPYIYNRDLPSRTREHYKTIYKAPDDLYAYFIFKSFDLLKHSCFASFITPNTFLTLSSKEYFRNYVLNKTIITLLYSGFVFVDAYVETAISIFQNESGKDNNIHFILDPKDYKNYEIIIDNQKSFKKNYLSRFYYPTKTNQAIWEGLSNKLEVLYKQFPKTLSGKITNKEKEKLKKHISHLGIGDVTLLGLICNGEQGLVTGNNSKYLAKIITKKEEEKEILNRLLNEIKIYTDVKITDNTLIDSKEELYKIAEELKEKHNNPALFGKFFLYKTVYENDLKNNKRWKKFFRGNTEGYKWYVPYSECIDWSEKSILELEKGIVTNSRWQGTRYFNSTGFAWVDYFTDKIKAFFVEKGPYSKSIVKLHCSSILTDEFAVGLLNSKFITYYVKNFITSTHTLQINDGRLIPIIVPEKRVEKKLEDLVDQILTAKREDPEADTTKLESEIDQMVYKLYGLTDEEIRVVEES